MRMHSDKGGRPSDHGYTDAKEDHVNFGATAPHRQEITSVTQCKSLNTKSLVPVPTCYSRVGTNLEILLE